MELPVAFIELLTATVMLFGAMPLFKECCGSPEKVKVTAKEWGKRQ
jgi:hypothetical protein